MLTGTLRTVPRLRLREFERPPAPELAWPSKETAHQIRVRCHVRVGPVTGARVVFGAILSALHVLALGLGLGSVFMRGRYLRALRAVRTGGARPALHRRHALGVAAAVWLLTGLARAFGRVEKAPEFYLRTGFLDQNDGSSYRSSRWRCGRLATFVRWRRAPGEGTPLPGFVVLAR